MVNDLTASDEADMIKLRAMFEHSERHTIDLEKNQFSPTVCRQNFARYG